MAGSKMHGEVQNLRALMVATEARMMVAKTLDPVFRTDAAKARDKIRKAVANMEVDVSVMKGAASRAMAMEVAISEAEAEYGQAIRKNLSRDEMSTKKKEFKKKVAQLESACQKEIKTALSSLKAFSKREDDALSVKIEY